jgi:SAM-dependent methyltransferase
LLKRHGKIKGAHFDTLDEVDDGRRSASAEARESERIEQRRPLAERDRNVRILAGLAHIQHVILRDGRAVGGVPRIVASTCGERRDEREHPRDGGRDYWLRIISPCSREPRFDDEASQMPPGTGAAVARPCPSCGGTLFTDRRVLPDLATSTCSSCGLILSTGERSGSAVPEFALVDPDGYLRSVGASRRRQAAEILPWLTRHVPPGATLLDVGCSFGFFLEAAREAGFRIRGIEPDPQAYAYAQTLLGEGIVRQGTLDGDTAAPASADVVATLDVIEHIAPDDHQAFAGVIRSVLRPGGVWVIKVPSTEGLYYKMSDLLVRLYPRAGASLVRRLWQTRYEYPHLVYFSLQSLHLWLERFGFRVVGSRYLPEVPAGTIIDRLTTDGEIGRANAYLAVPAVLGVTLIDSIRRKSDALVVFTRPRR